MADNAFININKKVLNNVQNNAPTSNINKPDQTKISFKVRKESVFPKKIVDKKLLYKAGGLLFVSCLTVSVIC